MRSNNIRTAAFLVCILMGGVRSADAQVVLWSITGPSGPTRLSGDTTQAYEFWIRPDPGADSAVLEIFDAALGGTADIVQGATPMATRFRLYRFDDVFSSTSLPLARREKNASPIAELTATDEVRMMNRWTPLSGISSSGNANGWVLLVDVTEGNDVNSYKVDVRDPGTGKSVWTIGTFDLPLCLYTVVAGSEVQVRSLGGAWGSVPPIRVAGAEGAPVRLRNDEGDARTVTTPSSRGSSSATWGIAVEGSPGAINNLVISVPDKSVLWDARPVLVQVPRKPDINVVPLPGNDCLELRFVLASGRFPSRTDRPEWRYGGRIFTGDTVAISFPEYGKHNIDVLVPSFSATLPRYWRETVSIRLSRPPQAVIFANRTVAGPKDPFVLSAARSVDPDGRRVSFRWFVNGALRGTGGQLQLEGLLPGRYLVRLEMEAQDPIGQCATGFAEQEIRVNGQPYTEIDGRTIAGTDVPLEFRSVRTTDIDADTLRYTWTGTAIDGSMSGPSIRLSHARAGQYSLRLVVDDGTVTENASYAAQYRYRINAAPVVDFSLPERIAPGSTVRVSARNVADADGDRLVYQWVTSDGQELTGRDVEVVWKDSGDVNVRLTVDDGQGVENSTQTAVRSIRVSPPVIPRIDAASLSTQSRQSFSAEGTVVPDPRQVTFGWQFGDGSGTTGQRVTHMYQRPGIYEVTVTTNDGLGLANSIRSKTHSITINAFPIAIIDAPNIWEPGRPLRFSGARSTDPDGSIAGYEWYLDGTRISANAADSVVLRTAGVQTLSLRVLDDSGLEDAVSIATHAVRSNTPPVAGYTVTPAAAAPGQTVTFDAGASYDPDGTRLRSYEWNFADGSKASGAKVQRRFDAAGRTVFSLSIDDGDGMNNSRSTVEGSILVNNAPIIVTETSARVTSQRVRLDASGSYDPDGDALAISWILPDGSTLGGSTVSWNAVSSGVQFVTVSADDGRGLANSVTQETVRIIINRSPVAVVDTLIFSCSGRPVLFTSARCTDADGDPLLASWDFGDGSTSTESNPVHTYAGSGLYTVTLTLSDGFVDEPVVARIPVIVEDSPTAVMSLVDTTICTGMSLSFSADASSDPNGPIVAFAWDFGNGTSALGPNVSTSYIRPGLYTVSLTVTGSGSGQCPRTHQTTGIVRVVAGPVAAFALPTVVSPGDRLDLDASGSQLNGQLDDARWSITSPDSSFVLSGLTASFVPETPGEYTVRLVLSIASETNCNTSSALRVVRVNAPPVASVQGPSAVSIGSTVQFDGRGSKDTDGIITAYRWTVDGTEVARGPVLSWLFAERGDHRIGLTIADNSGTRSSTAAAGLSVFANAAPRARFDVETLYYEGEQLSVVSLETTDEDGDELAAVWSYDGTSSSGSSIPLTPGRHTLVLRVDDGRGLPNSADSLLKEFSVAAAPSLDIPCPTDWTAGSMFDLRGYISDPAVILSGGENNTNLTLPGKTGPFDIQVGWAPRGTVLRTASTQIRIVEKLAFTSQAAVKRIAWNPANPRTVLTAPAVNRPAGSGVIYEWFSGGKPAGRGATVDVPLQRGEQTFVVRASDRSIMGSKPVETTLKVITE